MVAAVRGATAAVIAEHVPGGRVEIELLRTGATLTVSTSVPRARVRATRAALGALADNLTVVGDRFELTWSLSQK